MLSSGHDKADSKSFEVKVFWDPPLGAQRTQGKGGGRVVEAREVKETRRTWPQNQMNRVHRVSQGLKQQSRNMHGFVLGPLGVRVSLTFSSALGTLSVLRGCLAQTSDEGLYRVLLHLLMSCSADIPERPGLF